jgi:hypothetical protein
MSQENPGVAILQRPGPSCETVLASCKRWDQACPSAPEDPRRGLFRSIVFGPSLS